MDAVMISIRPEWCAKIANGEKTIEVRKTKPKLETPFKCYIYCTLAGSNKLFKETLGGDIAKWNREKWADRKGNVIGEFVCDAIIVDKTFGHDPMLYTAACMEATDVAAYCVNSEMYGWHISDLVIYDKPKSISEFIAPSETGCCNEGKCKGCFYFERGNGFNLEDDCKADFDTDMFSPVRRAPQSWCYVKKGH